MFCLHCGDCCSRLSPVSAPEPCPHLEWHGSFCFCSVNGEKPEDCIRHDFPSMVCPIGVGVLGIAGDAIRERIAVGREMLRLGYNEDEALCVIRGRVRR
jgi:hypothetical protein